ncbi:MAG: acyl-CoA dehydrogenase family protein [Candidatus Nezhaarchaeales archaeon]
MDFNLSDSQKMLQNMVKEIALKEVAPRAAEVDRTGSFPLENVKVLAKYNLLGVPFPVEYGGAGADMVSYAITIEELAQVCASTAFICAVHAVPAFCLQLSGSEEQKRRYLTQLANGSKLGAFALTEPNAGSDAAAIQTEAKLEGDEYVLNGSKCFITNAGYADIYVVFASTDKSKGARGISAFIVERGVKGLSFGRIEDKLGLRGSANGEVLLRDCRIPKENLIGREGEGLRIALAALDRARIGGAALGVGIAQAALNAAKDYAKKRVQFGQPIANLQAIQFMIADMATRVEAARLLTYRAARLADEGKRFTREAAMAKLYASEVAMKVTVDAVQIHGGYGLSKDWPVERYMRDAKAVAIIEGTSEIQRLVIARSELA